MKNLRIIENLANDLEFNGFDFNIILTIMLIGVIVIYLFKHYFGYWFIPDHPHKINRTLKEYYEHIKEYHPDIWEKYNLTDEKVNEWIRKVKESENNESR